MKKKHSIKAVLLRRMISLTAAIGILMSIAGCAMIYTLSMSNMRDRLKENEAAYNEAVQNAIAAYQVKIEAIAEESGITNAQLPLEQRKLSMSAAAKKYGFESVAMADGSGETTDGTNVSDREYFQKSLAGQTYISSPLVSKESGKNVLVLSAKAGGSSGGVVFARLSSDTFSKMVKNVSIGQGFIVDKTGTIIAHKKQDVVTKATNYITMSKTDASYVEAGAMVQRMIQGKSGMDSYSRAGRKISVSYAPISGTDGWSLAVLVYDDQMLTQMYRAIAVMTGMVVLFIAVSVIISMRTANSFANPITALVGRIEKLADGDLHSEVPKINSNNEIGVLSRSFTQTVDTLKGYVGEISSVLSSLKDGDCTVMTKQNYQGDFVTIRNSLEGIIDNLNNMFSQVRNSADQVAAGAEQVSNAAQSLSQGATEQASSIEELSASITEINEKTSKNASSASDANALSAETSQRMQQGKQQMEQMVSAMAAISESSAQIQKIIKTIQDIAFQTNILSLNAAVEAARAGEAGKGFAVVADEVRNLAGKSAEAAKNTSELIENSLAAVKNGREIADATEKSFHAILEASDKTGKLIGGIAVSSNEQASSIGQITQGVEQISAVVQTNSATSEESAAASEELSSQAQVMKDTLAFLKLKEAGQETEN